MPKAPVRGRAGSTLVEGRVLGSIKELRAATNECRRCQLWRLATQGVPGEGPAPASLMIVGEQPGDQEDLAGKPFVGPAGAILDRALYEAGIDRETAYVTNAVKHFKFELRGKRRLHAKPNTQEIQACNWWLRQEFEHVKPRLVIALGATAARAVLGRTVTIASIRGAATPLADNRDAWVTVHPSYLLRIPDEVQQRAEYARFVQELESAREWLQARPSRESSGAVEIRPPVAEHEPVVAQLRDRIQIEARGQDRVLALARLRHFRPGRVGDERGAVEVDVQPLRILQRPLAPVAIRGDERREIRGRVTLLRALPVIA